MVYKGNMKNRGRHCEEPARIMGGRRSNPIVTPSLSLPPLEGEGWGEGDCHVHLWGAHTDLSIELSEKAL
jgi:hypothetical protein